MIVPRETIDETSAARNPGNVKEKKKVVAELTHRNGATTRRKPGQDVPGIHVGALVAGGLGCGTRRVECIDRGLERHSERRPHSNPGAFAEALGGTARGG